MAPPTADGATIVPLGSHRGTVRSFDDPRGIGVVLGPDGTELAFHCTAIADGTRTIAEGTDVVFRVVPGRRGRWEAADLRPSQRAG
ncbi:cold-shock protein [Rhabdothermincola salaria]|uniref:cold-shock protein n=1 Tax=Rhabdothermincola salaria TaxID=2903142 RepID=UPI001E4AB1EF|nr:cold shock domain-containing protein [Rhabdothermincola salaria]